MPPFELRGVDHVVLRAFNLEQMQNFYVNMLGCTVEREFGALVQLRAGRSLIDLIPRVLEEPKGRNLDHICLTISPFEPDVLLRWLETSGVAGSEVANRYGAEGLGASLYIQDVEGNMIELKSALS